MDEQDVVPHDWMLRLSAAVAASIQEFFPVLRGTPIVLLAMDCQPWHGSLALSALTAAEAEADKLLSDPGEMAAWRHYDFTEGLASWQPTNELGRAMQTAYQAASDKQTVAEAFLSASAHAMADTEVAAATDLLKQAEGFRLSVAHPDGGREFLPVSLM